ncbi:hypothetical protein Kpol_1030p37 [Vanderwaltozyma polyspora DSM 70294]|uniref:UBX domain-containing protein 1 n=1 Tax=Vanderwaltozyma polyspora (strain ATCC 22028 / DSM 70294 / BCRC 21397 / CBS 2163 / NBRC 10782 / NRRL Y-8283 / UCD 57-17) TaxID=436907 RepID=A7TMV5_VANPO|nr:uncharacterized protein Kpol_1030p37 [Vanderwaltozyma polyspora DSM 70294]EDO16427.1 hypothetical protein Kpol_1030p37 [Vanderwaltozyma polyspora DSM 70294]
MSSENVQQFMAMANVSATVAEKYLNEYNGDLGDAINAYYAEQTETRSERNRSTSPKLSNNNSRSNSKFMSFAEMVKGQNDEDEDENKRNTFAGGETSGLEITDPNDSNSLIRDLLEKAKRGGQQLPKSDDDDSNQREEHFSGKGYRLGSVINGASEVVEDNGIISDKRKQERVTREITFWKEGFQVGEGELYRYDDPANSFYLNELNQGRAPLKLLNVEFGQEVDVNVYKKLDESYKAQKRKLGGFQGAGQRLGSPIPGDASPSQPLVADTLETESSTKENEDIQAPKGDSSVQIRYATGKREIYRCNATDTVQSLYDHVKANTNDSRAFTLNYSFPVKPIENFDSTIKEANLVNAVAVQRWV